MRRVLLPAVVLGLSLGAFSSSPARADGPAPDPLEKARALEQEGQALLDSGRCAEGARHLAEAWSLRARVWSRDAGMRPGESEGRGADAARARQKLEALRAALQAEDAAIQAAKGAGDRVGFEAHREKAEAIRREMLGVKQALAASAGRGGGPDDDGDEPGEARRELKALRKALHEAELAIEEAKKAGAERAQTEHMERAKDLRRRIEALAKAVGGEGKGRRGGADAELSARLVEIKTQMRAAQVAAERAAAEGKDAEAAEQRARADALRAAAEQIAREAKGREPGSREPKGREPGGRGAAAVDGLAGDVARLRAEMAEMRRLLEAMKERLGEAK
jgi:hypothetical protein